MPCSDYDASRLHAAGEYLAAVQVLRETHASDYRLADRTRRCRVAHDHLASLMAATTLIRLPGCLIRRDECGDLTILPGADSKKIAAKGGGK